MPVLPTVYRTANTQRTYAEKQMFRNPPLSQKQRKQVKTIAKHSQEPKRVSQNGNGVIVEGQHLVWNCLYPITQGLTASNRISNKINLESVQVNWTFVSDTTANAEVCLWIYAFWSDVESVTSSSGTTITNANVLTTLPFIGSVSSEFNALLQFDRFQCTPIKSIRKTVHLPFSTGGGRLSGTFKINARGKTIKYLHDSASYLEGKNLYIGVAATNNGTVDTTNTGSFFYNTLVSYRE